MEGLMPDGSIIAIPKKEAMAAIVAKTRGHAPEKPDATEKPAEETSRQASINAAMLARERLGIPSSPKK